jgi:hypothetical protein
MYLSHGDSRGLPRLLPDWQLQVDLHIYCAGVTGPITKLQRKYDVSKLPT